MKDAEALAALSDYSNMSTKVMADVMVQRVKTLREKYPTMPETVPDLKHMAVDLLGSLFTMTEYMQRITADQERAIQGISDTLTRASEKSALAMDMSTWPKAKDERVCPHGVGHPEPGKPHHGNGIHACDGCCAP